MRVTGGCRSVVLVALLLLGLTVACAGSSSNDTEEADATLDSDGDGVKDVDEERDGTDKDRADSDGDGVDDGAEKEAGTDPNDADDFVDPEPEAPVDDDEPAAPADDGSCDQSSGADCCEEDPEAAGCESTCDESSTELCVASIDDSQTCHNFNDGGGFSDERVFGQVFGNSGSGNFAFTFTVIENQASAGPEERIAQGAFNAAGEFVALVPLFGAGEVIQLTGADFGQGPVDPATLPEFTFTVTALDDAGSQCEALPN